MKSSGKKMVQDAVDGLTSNKESQETVSKTLKVN